MPKRKEKPTEPEVVIKRRIRIDNDTRNFKEFNDEIERFGMDAPPDLVAGRNKAQKKLDRAYEECTEYNVLAATSAVTTLTTQYSKTGIKLHLGRSKSATRNKAKLEFRQRIAREWHRENPDRPRGWQSKLAQHLSITCSSPGEHLSENTALQYLKRHKFFLY